MPDTRWRVVQFTVMPGGTYYVLSCGVTVKARTGTGLHHFVCLGCQKNWCEHVEFVKPLDDFLERGIAS